MPARRDAEENGSAAMLATKRLAGVAAEVCLCQLHIRLLLRLRGDVTRNPKQGCQLPLLMSSKNCFKKLKIIFFKKKLFCVLA